MGLPAHHLALLRASSSKSARQCYTIHVEHNPYFHKIVGVPHTTDEEKEKLNQFIIYGVQKEGGEFIEGHELQKTEKELELIEYVETCAENIANKYVSGNLVKVPITNIHIVKKGSVREITGTSQDGAHSVKLRSVLIERQKSELLFCVVLFHELLHLKGYSALQLNITPEEVNLAPYRSGLSIISRDSKKIFLNTLDEGIVEYLTKKFYTEISQHTDKFSRQEITQVSEKILRNRSKDVNYVEELAGTIHSANPDKFASKELVIEELVRAHFTGKLIKIGKLIESVRIGKLRDDVMDIN